MSQRLPYFKFETARWLIGDICFEPLEAQGLFINICAIYWQRDCVLSVEDIHKRFPKANAFDLLSGRYFKVENGFINIAFLDEQFAERTGRAKVNSRNGALGGRGNKANALQKESEPKAKESNIDKIREDKIREEPVTKEIFELACKNILEQKEFWAGCTQITKRPIPDLKTIWTNFVQIRSTVEDFKTAKELKEHFINWVGKQPAQAKPSSAKPVEVKLR